MVRVGFEPATALPGLQVTDVTVTLPSADFCRPDRTDRWSIVSRLPPDNRLSSPYRMPIRKGRNLTRKEDVVKYSKDAFAHAHRAISTLTSENLLDPIRDPYVEKLRTTRLDAAMIFLSHSWDHYGQMVDYLRLNNLVPPRHQ